MCARNSDSILVIVIDYVVTLFLVLHITMDTIGEGYLFFSALTILNHFSAECKNKFQCGASIFLNSKRHKATTCRDRLKSRGTQCFLKPECHNEDGFTVILVIWFNDFQYYYDAASNYQNQ